MGKLRIEDPTSKLVAEIEPEYGGRVTGLFLGNKPILWSDPEQIMLSPVLSGGIPVLFPFPSKTNLDKYESEGVDYYMPLHGFVKDLCFAVRSVSADTVRIWTDSGNAIQTYNYPFPFELVIEYRVDGNTLHISAEITNRSKKSMPHYLGWHPYFLASDKSKIRIKHSMKKHYDYVNYIDLDAEKEFDLTRNWDDVFHDPETNEIVIYNSGDGYQANIIFDEAYQSMILYTIDRPFICVEPCCGLPDSINNGRYLRWIESGKTEELKWKIVVSNYQS